MAKKDVDSFTDADLVKPASMNRLDDISFDELMSMSELNITDVDEISLVDKDTLINKPMIILAWNFSQGNFGEFVAVKVRTADGLYVFTDGSTGIYEQIARYQERLIASDGWDKFVASGMMVPKGLRKSEYTYTDEDGKEVPAVTYYIDNRA